MGDTRRETLTDGVPTYLFNLTGKFFSVVVV